MLITFATKLISYKTGKGKAVRVGGKGSPVRVPLPGSPYRFSSLIKSGKCQGGKGRFEVRILKLYFKIR